MQKQNFVVKCNEFNSDKMMFENFVETNEGKFLVSKIWYNDNVKSRPKSLLIQTTNLKVHDNNNDYISLKIDDIVIYNSIDNMVLNKIKKDGIIKKYGLKNPSYKSTVGEATNDTNLNVLRFNKINNTLFFVDTKESKSYDEVKNLISSDSKLKIIFEVDKVVVDIAKNYIFTYVTLLQAQIKICPHKIELSEYSFVDDDSDDEINNATLQTNGTFNRLINDTILNTQTEYMEECNNDKSESIESSESSESNESNESSESSESNESNKLSDSDSIESTSNFNIDDENSESDSEIESMNYLNKVTKNKKH